MDSTTVKALSFPSNLSKLFAHFSAFDSDGLRLADMPLVEGSVGVAEILELDHRQELESAFGSLARSPSSSSKMIVALS